jgi:hypothetical protein
MQSAGSRQAWPSRQPSEQALPQSVSDSAPFCTESLQVAAWHCPPWHTPLTQSEPARQANESAHAEHSGPPQSRSVSSPFSTASSQTGAAQILLVQTLLVQSVAILQL